MTGIALSILPLWFKSAFSTAAYTLSSLIFISAIASWIPQVRDSTIGYWLNALTDPIIAPVRKVLRRVPALAQMPVDFSPIITFFLLSLIRDIVISL